MQRSSEITASDLSNDFDIDELVSLLESTYASDRCQPCTQVQSAAPVASIAEELLARSPSTSHASSPTSRRVPRSPICKRRNGRSLCKRDGCDRAMRGLNDELEGGFCSRYCRRHHFLVDLELAAVPSKRSFVSS